MKDTVTPVVAVVLSLVIGLVGGTLWGVERGRTDAAELFAESSVETDTASSMDHAMEGMTTGLEGKTGDTLDKAFLESMIVHHEGAVEMAEMVKDSKHKELRDLSAAIIKAQTREITQMKKWLGEWYK